MLSVKRFENGDISFMSVCRNFEINVVLWCFCTSSFQLQTFPNILKKCHKKNKIIVKTKLFMWTSGNIYPVKVIRNLPTKNNLLMNTYSFKIWVFSATIFTSDEKLSTKTLCFKTLNY